MPPKYLWITATVGAVCGIFAVLFAKLFPKIEYLLEERLSKIHESIRITIFFILVAAFGLISNEMIGSGHHLIHDLMSGHAPIWYFMIAILFIRSALFLLSGSVDVVGGLSVPAMTIGALIGSILSEPFVAIGVFPAEYTPVLVMVGVASFLAAVNRAPLNAITFAAEALMGFSNIFGVIVGVALAFIVIEPLGVTAFSDVLIEEKAHESHIGKKSATVDTHLTASSDAFITGKEVRDILWPANCIVLSVDKKTPSNVIQEGDVLHMRYKTFDNEETYAVLESIIGKQNTETDTHNVHENDEGYTLPEQ
jgi:H+/Cl- antiporter ClcA